MTSSGLSHKAPSVRCRGLRLKLLMTIGVVLLLMVVFAYTSLSGLIGSSLAANLKERHRLREKPMVEGLRISRQSSCWGT